MYMFPMHCPRCDDKLNVEHVRPRGGDARVEVDWCGRCGGIWLDKGEAEVVCPVFGYLGRRSIEIEALGAPGCGIERCPRCDAVPFAFMIVDAEIDYCIACGGVWLDTRESAGHLTAQRDMYSGGPYRALESAAKAEGCACASCGKRDELGAMYMSGRGLLCRVCHAHVLNRAQVARAQESDTLAQRIVTGLCSGFAADYDRNYPQ